MSCCKETKQLIHPKQANRGDFTFTCFVSWSQCVYNMKSKIKPYHHQEHDKWHTATHYQQQNKRYKNINMTIKNKKYQNCQNTITPTQKRRRKYPEAPTRKQTHYAHTYTQKHTTTQIFVIVYKNTIVFNKQLFICNILRNKNSNQIKLT